jgi:hypothetical protein
MQHKTEARRVNRQDKNFFASDLCLALSLFAVGVSLSLFAVEDLSGITNS